MLEKLSLPFLLRSLVKALDANRKELAELNKTHRLMLKALCVVGNVRLSELEELEELTPAQLEAVKAEGPELLVQSEADMAELETLEKVFAEAHGRAPGYGDHDLQELRRLARDRTGRVPSPLFDPEDVEGVGAHQPEREKDTH